MSERFEANAQYNDLLGEVAIDGFDGHFLHELAEKVHLPSEFWPVGFYVYNPTIDGEGLIDLTLVAIPRSVAGNTMDEIIQYAKGREEVTTYPFDCKIHINDLMGFMKRLHITVKSSDLARTNLVINYDNRISLNE